IIPVCHEVAFYCSDDAELKSQLSLEPSLGKSASAKAASNVLWATQKLVAVVNVPLNKKKRFHTDDPCFIVALKRLKELEERTRAWLGVRRIKKLFNIVPTPTLTPT